MFCEQSGTTLVSLNMCSAVVELGQHSPDWQLEQLTGECAKEPRVFRTHVVFEVLFANVPMVHVGITGFDIDNRDTARLSVRAEAISAFGFDLVVRTWLHTWVYSVETSWIALGHQSVV